MRSIATATALLLGMGSAAHAVDTLAAGPLFFDLRQDNVACGVFNAGPFPVTVLSVQIFTTGLRGNGRDTEEHDANRQ